MARIVASVIGGVFLFPHAFLVGATLSVERKKEPVLKEEKRHSL